MEDRIYKIKDKLLSRVEKETQDTERMNIERVGCLIDAIHHLAETEYYCSVADSMWAEKHGYVSGGGTGSSAPVTQARMNYSSSMRPGYVPQETMGYDDPISDLRTKYQKASPDERERIRMETMKMVGAL